MSTYTKLPADAFMRQIAGTLIDLTLINVNDFYKVEVNHYISAICDGTITYIPNTWDNKLLYYVAFALDHCPDSASINVEEIRDQIRGDIAAILPEYKPRYRSYPEF